MAHETVHLSQAAHNEDCLTYVMQATDSANNNSRYIYVDWVITICFYTIVHYAEAWLDSHHNLDSKNHDHRQKQLEDYNRIRVVYEMHSKYKNLSNSARYLITDPSSRSALTQTAADFFSGQTLPIQEDLAKFKKELGY